MNNSKENFKPKYDFLDELEALRVKHPEKFFFLEAFVKALANREKVSLSLSINSDLHTIRVSMKNHAYKEDVGTLEAAKKSISTFLGTNKDDILANHSYRVNVG